MRVADAIADWLYEKNISHAYGIIGGGNAVIFDALQKAGKITIVCCHHEQAAAMASAYYNRIREGLESVVLCTTGAGSTNAITGVMAAYMDSIPLLVLSGNEALASVMRGRTRVLGVQGYDSRGVAEGFSKLALRIVHAEQVPAILDFAYDDAMKHRQGPVWVDLPKDVANATI